MKKKLLVVHMSLYSGGAERSLLNFLQTLPEDAYDVDLMLFREEGHGLAQLPKHIRLIQPPTAVKWLYWNPNSRVDARFSVKRAYYRCVRMISTFAARMLSGKSGNREKQLRWKIAYRHIISPVETHYDVAMAYLHGEITYFTLEKVHADRVLAWVHNDYSKTGLSAEFDRRYFEKANSIATISDTCKEILQKTFPELQDKFVVLPNIVSEKEIRIRAEEPLQEPFSEDMLNIVSIGRLEAQKAPEWSLEAAKILKSKGVPFRWYWIGHGNMAQLMTDKINELELQDCFRLMGIRENPYPYIKACDIFVQNSRYEGKSIALDEAKILAKPIVITEYPTSHDQLADDEGLIVKMNPEAVAEGIEKLKDKEKRDALTSVLMSRHYGCEHEITKYMDWIEGR